MVYEFDGKKYEEASSHQKEWGNRLISDLKLKGGEAILDLGCGDGVLTENLGAVVPNGKVLGIDASRGMIELARKKESYNVTFELMDINKILLKEKFDVIFSNAALHWVKDHKRLWVSMGEILNPLGIIRLNFAAYGNCGHFLKVVRNAFNLDEYKDTFTNFVWPWYMPKIEEYKNIIFEDVFSKVEVWGDNADRYFPDEETIIKWIDQPSLVPFLKELSGNKMKSFRDYVVNQMIKETRQKDGRCFETFRRINVRAKKTDVSS